MTNILLAPILIVCWQDNMSRSLFLLDVLIDSGSARLNSMDKTTCFTKWPSSYIHSEKWLPYKISAEVISTLLYKQKLRALQSSSFIWNLPIIHLKTILLLVPRQRNLRWICSQKDQKNNKYVVAPPSSKGLLIYNPER